MRIASLLPAATEWICAFGAAGDLVARSHGCDFPPDAVADVAVVTEATYDDTGDSAAIDAAVRSTLQDGLSLYRVDLDRLRALDPDVIVTQAQCAVCAVTRSDLDAALADWSGATPTLVSLEPRTYKEVLDGALRLGRTLGRTQDAMRVIAKGEKRLAALRNRLGVSKRVDPETLPTVACIEWMDPLMVAGHWMPDLAEHAGARTVLGDAGARSPTVAWSALRDANPDVVAVMPCGFALDQTRRDFSALTSRDGWADLDAVRNGRVVRLDGNAYFNRAGPRLVRSAELLAHAVHGDRAGVDAVAPWELERAPAL